MGESSVWPAGGRNAVDVESSPFSGEDTFGSVGLKASSWAAD